MNQYNSNGNREGYWERYLENGKLGYKSNFRDGNYIGYWIDSISLSTDNIIYLHKFFIK